MKKQPSYQDLLKSRDLLEKKVKKLELELKAQFPPDSKTDVHHFYYQLFSKANNIILIHKSTADNLPGQIIMANPAAKKALGYTDEEFRKMNLSDLFKKQKQKQTSPEVQIREMLKSERILITKKKKRILTEVHTHSFDHQGNRYGFTVIHDITEHKNATDALRLSEEKYKRLVESLSDEYIFYSHDKDGMITYISPSIRKVLGYTQEEALRNYKEFLTDHEMNQKALVHSELSHKGILQPPFLNELYHRDGTTRIFYNTEIPVFDDAGNVIAVEGIARDITDALKSEKQLKIYEERFRLLVENIEEVFWIFDLKEDKLLYISPKYEKVYHKSVESLYNKPGSFLKSVHPEDIKTVKKAYNQIEKGKGFDIEYRVLDPDKKIKWIWSRSFVILDEKKKPVLVVGIAFDITEKKNAQLDKNLLAAIVENTEDHAVIKDTNLKIIASNRANTQAAGKKKVEDMIGKTDLEIYGDHPHVRQYMEDDRKAMQMKKGEILVNEQIFVYPGGRKVQSLVKKFPVFDEQNKLIAVASISRDITNYKKALKDHAESEKKYNFLIEKMAEGLGIIDADYRFTFINKGLEELVGVDRGKLIGTSLVHLFDKETGKKITEALKHTEKNAKQTFQVRLKQGRNRNRIIQIIALPHYQNHKKKSVFLMFKDITDWVEIENNLLKSENKLKDVNAAKDKFFSIIAHDLKNPFNSILNFSDLLLKHYGTYDKDEVLTFIKMIHESSRQAYSLLDNLLNWSRTQTSRMDFNPTTTDIYNIISDIIGLLEGTAMEKNIILINNIKPKTYVFCDPNMISTVIRNLLSNAIKFTRPAGKVTFNSKSGSKMTEISVTDTGVGIKEENFNKLFKIDVHFSTSGTANEEGTGLGLILCHEYVKINNGKLRIKSKVDKGSTFFVDLPNPPKNTPYK